MDGYAERFERLHRAAYRVGYRLLGEREEAMDVAQESMARAYARWSTVSGYADAWVCSVATNLAIDVIRKRSRRPVVAEEGHEDPHREERLDLQRAIAKLPRRQRQVVVMRYLADLPEDAVAVALGCSVGSVKTHGSRGVAALRERLAYSTAGGAL